MYPSGLNNGRVETRVCAVLVETGYSRLFNVFVDYSTLDGSDRAVSNKIHLFKSTRATNCQWVGERAKRFDEMGTLCEVRSRQFTSRNKPLCGIGRNGVCSSWLCKIVCGSDFILFRIWIMSCSVKCHLTFINAETWLCDWKRGRGGWQLFIYRDKRRKTNGDQFQVGACMDLYFVYFDQINYGHTIHDCLWDTIACAAELSNCWLLTKIS